MKVVGSAAEALWEGVCDYLDVQTEKRVYNKH